MNAGLAGLFLLTALLYAAVGFGGGSTYNALLVLSGADYRLLPSIALACNIIVVTGGVWRFSREGHLQLERIAPFLFASVPMAWVGGRMPVTETVFVGLLGGALLISGARLIMQRSADAEFAPEARTNWLFSLTAGGGIGLLAGLVGIGGGIFLAPLLYLTRWGRAREIAAACSLFILANSLSGLAGQLMKLGDLGLLQATFDYWPLLVAVFIGGSIGSWLGATRLNGEWVRRLTGILILYVSVRLLLRWSYLFGLNVTF